MKQENGRTEQNKRVSAPRRPLWVKFAACVMAIIFFALVLDTVIISILISGDVRVTAEATNYNTNQQRAAQVNDFLQGDMDDARLHLNVLEATGTKAVRDMTTTNFFRIHRNIAAVVVDTFAGGDQGTRLVNNALLALNRADPSVLDDLLTAYADDFNRAALGYILLRNVTDIMGFQSIGIFFPFGSKSAAVLWSTAQLNTDFGIGANQSLMVNDRGEVVSHGDPELLQTGVIGPEMYGVIMGMGLDNMQTVARDANGTLCFIAIRRLPALGGSVITKIPQATVFEGVRATVRRNVYLVAMILSLSLAFAWLFSKTVTRPVETLVQAVRQVGRGDYSASVPISTNDELGELSASFNTMSRSIAQSHSELDRANLKLQEVNESLENTVKERTSELERQTALAQAASTAKGDFLAAMSHEIRTPLTAIIGMSDLMPRVNFDETQADYFNKISGMSHILMDIVNDILDFSKIETGKMELLPRHYNLRIMFENLASAQRFQASAKGLEFRAAFDPGLPEVVYGDDARVRQIMMNLVSNAVKYTKDGFVEFSLNMAKRRRGKLYIAVVVRDSGIGIREEQKERLFTRFERLDREQNRMIQGTGLGLAITRQLLDLMGGFITIESVYGEGSTFSAFIPLVKGDVAKVETARGRDFLVRAAGDLRVLVVDDGQANRTVASGYLARHGITADTAESGEEALSKIGAGQYDLIFMDHLMPGMGGPETTQAIRALEPDWCKTVPIVAFSANAIQGAREFFIAAGMNDFISKPIRPDELNRVLRDWLPSDKIELLSPHGNAPLPAGKKPGGGSLRAELDRVIPDLGAALEHTGGMGELREYLEVFHRELPSTMDTLRETLAAGDLPSYRIAVHKVKGMMGILGAAELEDRAKSLEDAAAGGDGDSCRTDSEGAITAFMDFRDKIGGLSFFHEGRKRAGADRALVIEKLEALCSAASNSRLDNAMDLAAELEGLYPEGTGEEKWAEDWGKIKTRLDRIDFSGAAGEIRALIERMDVRGGGA
ncbi:MAG: response regulator [Spirochaetaceae bacterium]|jgi:signal transduction histidine kinase/HPt (histidine-containing phosphotransfer) domain-containing protein/ActR/RegA family two-component response regulator|nr:response regulator [Spirochaetaceae bacterium]